MKIEKSDRGFLRLTHNVYVQDERQEAPIIIESSAVGDYEDSFDRPGSSFLWVGQEHHLNREEVNLLVGVLQYWLNNKRLPEKIG